MRFDDLNKVRKITNSVLVHFFMLEPQLSREMKISRNFIVIFELIKLHSVLFCIEHRENS